MAQNKIITPFISIQNTPPSGTPYNTSNLEMLSSLLIQQAATEIFVVPYNEKEQQQLKSELSSLPEFVKRRVKQGDEDFQILKDVKKYLEPVYDIPFSVTKVSENGKGSYFDPYLESSLRLLALACKKNSEVDIPEFGTINNRLKWLKQNCQSSEGKFRVDNLIGLFGCYSSSSNAGFKVNPSEYKKMKISERLDELLTETDLQELSKTRHQFGIPASLKKVSELKSVLHLKAKKLIQNEKFSKLLGHTPQITSLALSGGTVTVPAISIPEWERYNPPIVELTDIRKKLLEEIPDLGNHIFLMADSPLVASPAPGQVGAPDLLIPGQFRISNAGLSINIGKLLNPKKHQKNSESHETQESEKK